MQINIYFFFIFYVLVTLHTNLIRKFEISNVSTLLYYNYTSEFNFQSSSTFIKKEREILLKAEPPYFRLTFSKEQPLLINLKKESSFRTILTVIFHQPEAITQNLKFLSTLLFVTNELLTNNLEWFQLHRNLYHLSSQQLQLNATRFIVTRTFLNFR